MNRDNPLADMRPIWWEILPGVAARGWDSGDRLLYNIFSFIFYIETDGRLKTKWVHTSSLIDRT